MEHADTLKGKAQVLKALANEKRLRIALSLYEAPLTFSEIARRCGFNSSSELSFHLNMMRGLIRKRADGKYELTSSGKALVELVNGLPPIDIRVERVSCSTLDKILISLIIGIVFLTLLSTGCCGENLYLVASNMVVCLLLILVYVFRYQLVERYPYLVNLPAFVQLLSSPVLTPEERGEYINKIFRASLIIALLSALMIPAVLGIRHGDMHAGLINLLIAGEPVLIILYYRKIYVELKKHVSST